MSFPKPCSTTGTDKGKDQDHKQEKQKDVVLLNKGF